MEKQTQTKILTYLQSIGAYPVKVVLSTKNGVPDILACINGSFFAFEVKDKGEKPTPLQQYNIRKIKEAGGNALTVWSLEEVKEFIKLVNKNQDTKANTF